MSGGSFDYKYQQIKDFADQLNTYLERDDYNGAKHKETVLALEKCYKIIKIAGELAYAVEWFYSDDYGEETFMEEYKKIIKKG